MYNLFKVFERCCFCKKDSNLEYVNRHGIYGDAGMNIAYHEKCLHLVCDSPEDYGHRMIDKAINIINLIKYWKKRDEERKEKLRFNCKYLKENCA